MDAILILTRVVGKQVFFEEMNLVWLTRRLLFVQNSETGVKFSKIAKRQKVSTLRPQAEKTVLVWAQKPKEETSPN